MLIYLNIGGNKKRDQTNTFEMFQNFKNSVDTLRAD